MSEILKVFGIQGGDLVRTTLTNCEDPEAAIREIQEKNGIQLPSLQPALPFLDLYGVRRLEFHQSTLDLLRDKLLLIINNLAASNRPENLQVLSGLLDKCFPAIKLKSLQPVVMTLLKHIPKIKKEYLEAILADRELYAEAATATKRQIWQDHQALFGDEVLPLLTRYIREKEEALLSHENQSASFFLPQPKVRRQGEVVQRLVDMIGKNIRLYDLVLQFLRTLFLRTRNSHYCTLRAELLMAVHDMENNDICSMDPVHKFTWCVDACIRERMVNSSHARELQVFLDGIKKGQEYVLGDLSMVLCDPYAMHTILLSLMKVLQHCVITESLPRENQDLILLVRMMALGLGAWGMIDSQDFREPRTEPSLITKFLPKIVGLMVDDTYHMVSARITEDPQHSNVRQPFDMYIPFMKASPIASMAAMYYTLHAAKQRDHTAIVAMLPLLLHCENDRAFEDAYLHALISYLIPMAEDFVNEPMCSAVFDDFLLPMIFRENILRHLLRLLWYIHHRLPQSRLDQLLESIQPNMEHSEAVHTTYRLLSEKISNFEPSPTPAPEPVDSPLLSVPVPTPAARN